MKIAWSIILLTVLLLLYPAKGGDSQNDRLENFKQALRDAHLDSDKEELKKSERHVGRFSKCPIENFVGTNLFDGTRKKCFSQEDVALLTARMDFEMLLPKDLLTENAICDELAVVLLQYFYESCHVIQRMSDESVRHLTERAFYDALGGYLKSYMMPMVQYAFYAGQMSLKTTQSVNSLYDQCKRFLNTNGNGWHGPMEQLATVLCNIPIEPLRIESKNRGSGLCCSKLNIENDKEDYAEGSMFVPLPKLDAEDEDGFLTTITLPFKCKRTYNLRSEKSAFMIVKYFETATRCFQFRGMTQNDFNQQFKNWFTEHIQVHLTDEQFYPGLGAVLRLYEGLSRNKKAVTLKNPNTDEYEDYLNAAQEDDYEFNLNEDEHYFNEKSVVHNDDEIANLAVDENDKLNCNKSSSNPICSPKQIVESEQPESQSDDERFPYFDWILDHRILKFVALILVLLLLICLIFITYRYLKKRYCDNPQPPDNRGSRLFQRLFCRQKEKSPDEEHLILHETKPEPSGFTKIFRQTSTSSSSLAGGSRKKRVFRARNAPEDSTSRDTTSEKMKSPPKVVRIDEKKNSSKNDKKSKDKPSKDKSKKTKGKATPSSSEGEQDYSKSNTKKSKETGHSSRGSWETTFS